MQNLVVESKVSKLSTVHKRGCLAGLLNTVALNNQPIYILKAHSTAINILNEWFVWVNNCRGVTLQNKPRYFIKHELPLMHYHLKKKNTCEMQQWSL